MPSLVDSLRQLIAESRLQVLRAVDVVQALSAEFGRGFDGTNLRHMRGFYLAFPIRDALRRQLSWMLLPSEEELRLELKRDRQAIEEHKNLSIEDDTP